MVLLIVSVMGDTSIRYRYWLVFSYIESIDLISKSQYFDAILHVICTGLLLLWQFLTTKVTNKFSVCFHYSIVMFTLSTSA